MDSKTAPELAAPSPKKQTETRSGIFFSRMVSDEGLVVESKVVDHTGVTRTVVSSGLKKLEVAGVIESKALGMKGTHIRVVNDELRTELSRIKY